MTSADRQAVHRHHVLVRAAKLALAVGIIALLAYQLRGQGVFQRLLDEPKRWDRLAVAQLLVLAAMTLNYVRWWVLVRALELQFTLRDAFRLGTMGLLLNQVSPGSVGGDLFKAVFIAREQPAKRTEAVASVVIDRMVGLYAMLLVASAGYLAGGGGDKFSPLVHGLARTVLTLAVVGAVGIGLFLTSALTGARVRTVFGRAPRIGGTLIRLLAAADVYRLRRRYLFLAILVSCVTHTLFVIAIWTAGRGLPIDAPGLATTFVVGPLSLAAGAIPVAPSGLGTFEGAMEGLYRGVGARRGDGLLAAITYRVMTYVMAAVGAVYYIAARRTVADVLHEAEEMVDEQAAGDG